MRNSIKHLVGAAALAAVVSVSPAASLLVEDFNFTGTLVANGWVAHSGAGTESPDTTTGLTYAGFAGSGVGNAANLDNTGEDVNKIFAATTSGAVYCAFMVNVPSSTVTEGYFFHFGQENAGVMNTTTFHGKTYLASDGTGDYELGLTFQANAPIVGGRKTSLDLAFGTTYLVVLKYNIIATVAADDEVSLYVFTSGVPGTEPGTATIGPISATADTSTDLTNVFGVGLRQYSANQRIIVDGIRVATTWAEAAVAADVADWSVYN